MIAFALVTLSAAVVYCLANWYFKQLPLTPAWILFILSGFTSLLYLILRSAAISFPALTGLHESLLFFSAVITLIISVPKIYRHPVFTPAVRALTGFIAAVLLMISVSPVISSDLVPPLPALQSNWLVLHVAFSFFGEAFFTFAFITSLIFLFSKEEEKKKRLINLTSVFISIGYPLFTVGALIFGAIWAEAAWGRYWSWDSKEIWALVTWMVYSAYIHVRYIKKGSATLAAVLSVAGFLLALFTLFGVNYLLESVHGYR